MPAAPLAFLHTAASQVALFDALLRTLAPATRARHRVEPGFLARVRAAGGVPPDLASDVRSVIAALLREGARVVVCTCSSLGACAEACGPALAACVLRIDRPMAELAIDAGSPLLVVAALETALAPTCVLLRDTALRRGARPAIRTLLCRETWPLFETADRAGYHAAVAAAVRGACAEARAVVLAQASMAGAETLCADLGIPVLCSPRSGLEAALACLPADLEG